MLLFTEAVESSRVSEHFVCVFHCRMKMTSDM